jgi:IS5 family transposase
MTDDFFGARLDQMIDLRHLLAVLATRMPWAEIEAALAPVLTHKDRMGQFLSLARDLRGQLTRPIPYAAAASAIRG